MFSLKSIFVLVFLVCGAFCVLVTGYRVRRVAGGHTAIPNSETFVVSLQSNRSHLCAGALITPDYVLTSAGCVEQSPNQVLTGSQKVITNIQRHEIESIKVHENYIESQKRNDVALVKLADHLVLNGKIQTVEVSTIAVASNLVTTFYGWGFYEEEDGGRPSDLQVLYQKSLSFEDCGKWYVNDSNFTEGHICSFIQKGQGTCTDDIGGPLISNGKLIGILNWFSGCGTGNPDVFADVAKYSTWIQNNLV